MMVRWNHVQIGVVDRCSSAETGGHYGAGRPGGPARGSRSTSGQRPVANRSFGPRVFGQRRRGRPFSLLRVSRHHSYLVGDKDARKMEGRGMEKGGHVSRKE
jgi:hypothetical protein